MKKLIGGLFLLVLISGCSNKNVSSPPSNNEKLINKQKTEITRLKEEIITLKGENELLNKRLDEVSPNIQLLDHQSRYIMKLIQEGNLDELENNYKLKIKLTDDHVLFDEVDVQPFPVELANLPMYFAFYNPNEDFTEVGYYLYDNEPERERKYLIAFYYDKEKQFRYIISGDT